MYLKRAKLSFCAAFGCISLLVTLYAVGKFILFTSTPIQQKQNLGGKPQELKVAVRLLLWNSIYLVIFMLQHSLQKHENFKNLWRKIGLETIERSAYNLVSSLMLLQLVQSWSFVEKWSLWNFSATPYSSIWWILTTIHSVLWLIIALGSLLMDLPELLGIKQIYYEIQGLNDPMLYKAPSLNRLLSKIRHPSFIGFTSLFWITNLMSLDRFILAIFLTSYCLIAWKPDRTDYQYQRQQFELKKLELNYDLKQN